MSDRPMPQTPLVDVVLCTHRVGEYLEEALDSVINQTWPHWRLTLVDDGSNEPDGLERMVNRITDSQVIHQRWLGQAAARNNGIRNSSGELITFLDDDDVWRPERLERLVTALLDDPFAVGAFSGGWYMNADGEPLGTSWTAPSVPSSDMLRGRVPFPRIVAMLLTRDIVAASGGFNESFALAEDDELILRVLAAGELVAVPEPLVGYRRHSANLTNAHISARRAASERLLALHIQRAESAGDTELERMIRENQTAYRRQAGADCMGSAILAFHARDFPTGAKEIAWALRRAPSSFLKAAAGRTGGTIARSIYRPATSSSKPRSRPSGSRDPGRRTSRNR